MRRGDARGEVGADVLPEVIDTVPFCVLLLGSAAGICGRGQGWSELQGVRQALLLRLE